MDKDDAVEKKVVVEDGKVVVKEVKKVETKEKQNEEVDGGELTPSEIKAMDGGWKPQDVWVAEGGDPDKWVPADEFNRRGELFGKISAQNTQIKELKKSLDALKQHHSKVFEASYQRALKDLQRQKVEAIKEGETEVALKVDEDIDNLKEQYDEQKKQFQPQPIQVTPDEEFPGWLAENSWYTTDQEMHTYADRIGIVYAQTNPHLDNQDVREWVTEQVRRKYPHKFRQQQRPAAPNVEGAGRAKPGVRQKVQLTDMERDIMKTLVKSGVLTEEEYMADMAALKRG